jgi:hypothetical protein
VGFDPTLLKEIPSEVIVHRTLALDLPFGIKKQIKKLAGGRKPLKDSSAATPAAKPNFLKRVLQNLLLPDPQVTWLPVLTRAARRVVKERNIELILITVPPFSCVLLVEKMRKVFPGLAIVVDFRDEWLSTAIDLVGFGRTDRTFEAARNMEASAVAKATAVVAVTEASRRQIRARYPQAPDSKFHLIPNGFDATSLHHSGPLLKPRPDGKIVVTHIGTIYAATEPTALVQAVQSLPPELKSRFKLSFIGHIEEPRFREALLQLGDMVELKGFLPQREALATMDQTDYVLLINHDHLNVSGKFYDYVGAGKPILGCVHPEGETRRLFDELQAGWWAAHYDVEGIRQLFVDAAARGDSLHREFQPNTVKIAQYERRVLARRYAALLHSIVGK